jgi:methionine-rich copper-binding protein CopC
MGHDGPMRSPRRRPSGAAVASWLLVVASMILLAPAVAHAHAVFLGSEPAAGDEVTNLNQVTLRFAADVAADGDHRLVIETDDGRALTALGFQQPDPRSLIALLEGVPAGEHEVAWEIVAADGHRESGRFPVTVLEGVGTVPVTEEAPTGVVGDPDAGATATPEGPSLARSLPAAGQRVSVVGEIRLEFDDDLAATAGQLVAVRTAGGEVAAPEAIERPDARTLVARYPGGLPDGDHEIVFEVEDPEGRQASGRIPFTVAPADEREGGPAPLVLVALAVLLAAAVAGFVWRARRGSGEGADA